MIDGKTCRVCLLAKAEGDFADSTNHASGKQTACRDCLAAYLREYRKANADKVKEANRLYRKCNPTRPETAEQAERRRERDRKTDRARYERMPPEMRRQRGERSRQLERKRNPSAVQTRCAARRAAKAQRTVAWADKKAIARIYATARRLRDDGIDVHVDHMYPLMGRTVCGLHVEHNLQLVLGNYNLRKNARIVEPDSDEHIAAVDDLILALCTPSLA